jgi:hypothetical protein
MLYQEKSGNPAESSASLFVIVLVQHVEWFFLQSSASDEGGGVGIRLVNDCLITIH